MCSILKFLFAILIVGSLFTLVIHFWLLGKDYIFNENDIQQIAMKYVGQDPKQAYDQIYQEFLDKYPGHILPHEDRQWVFMNAGGWMGSINILHASLTEYVLFFGTAINTSGNSGRYWANISDTILTGSFRQWKEGELQSTVFIPGQTVYHIWFEAAAVEWAAGTWMVEYGRGFIPSTLGFALADTFFSTQDFVTLFHILHIYTKAMLLEIGTFVYAHQDS